MTAIEIIKNTIDNMFPLAGATMDWTLHKQINAAIIDALIDYDSPAGVPIPILSDTASNGHHFFDHGLLNIADCPKLYAIWGTRFNIGGEASGTFRCPPCAPGTVFVQAGASGYNDIDLTLFATGGEIKHQLTVGEMPRHRLKVEGIGNGHIDGTGSQVGPEVDGGDTALYTEYVGNDEAHNNMQPYTAVNYMFRLC